MGKSVSNWGKYPVIDAEERSFSSRAELQKLLAESPGQIARGLGRCYGDSSLSSKIVSSKRFNRYLSFDRETGILDCESGVSLAEVLELVVPAGWFVPVTPGTKFVTVGGAVASDVHGKNHHKEGSFCDHCYEIELMNASGQIYTCGPKHNFDLFDATRGGMGLTGVILRVKFQLKKIETAFITTKEIKARNLDEVFDLFQKYHDYTYSVSWVDCLQTGKDQGRSILMLGEHTPLADLPSKYRNNPLPVQNNKLGSIPFNFPDFALNKLSIKAFNFLFYAKNLKKEQNKIGHYNPYFYPLDAIYDWNRMYGKRGFTQYQFVLPPESSKEGLRKILTKINKERAGSFLTVLKEFGPQDGLISFPHKGYTLTLDFPITDDLFPFLDEMDRIVLDHGGRLYMTKDVRMSPQMLGKGYPNLDKFLAVVKKYNPEGNFSSLQSERLDLS